MPQPSALANAALEYADLGFPVFPCVPNAKRPLTERGNLDASTDPDVIAEWWEAYPDANIGIATAGLIVIDVDGEGNAWPNDPEKAVDLSNTALSITPRGGRHFIYRQPAGAGWRNTAGTLAPQVDTRADGGYILAAPSMVNGKPYQWVNDLPEPADLPTPPPWLADALNNLATANGAPGTRTDAPVDGNEIPSGQRNHTLARLAGAMRRVGMAEAEIEAALKQANAGRCNPPLPDKEVQKIAWSVARYDPDQIAVAVAEAHWEQDAAQTDPNTRPDPLDPGEFPIGLLKVPGFVGDVMAYNLETAHRPQPVLALAGALCLQATLAARKIRDARGNRTNIYMVAAAASGAGKDRARKVNREILFEAGLDILEGNEDFASDAGLLKAVETQPAILFQVDEIGRLLKTVGDPRATHLFNIVTAFLRLYSAADSVFKGKAYADKRQNLVIDQPCVSLYGLTIPETLYKSLTFEALTDGFLARLMIFDIEGRGERQRVDLKPIPQKIIDAARWWGNFCPGGNLAAAHPEPEPVETTAEAGAIFDALADLVDVEAKRGDAAARALWARAEEKACRLALIYAASANRDERMVTGEAATWACAMADYLTRRMLWLAHTWVSENQFDAKQKNVIRIVRDAGGTMTRSELSRRTRAISTRERVELIENLKATGQIREETEITVGRPRVSYVLN